MGIAQNTAALATTAQISPAFLVHNLGMISPFTVSPYGVTTDRMSCSDSRRLDAKIGRGLEMIVDGVAPSPPTVTQTTLLKSGFCKDWVGSPSPRARPRSQSL